MAVSSPSCNPGSAVSTITALCAWLIAASCGNSGSPDNSVNQSPFAFPLDAPPLAPMTTVNAFPALGYARPVFVTHAPDGSDRVFIVEQAGRILVHANDAAATQADVFLDLTSRVTANIGEMGLLGLAFDPDYAQDGKFYVYYLRDNPLESVIAEFRVTTDPDAADPASERVLMVVPQPFGNHNAGMLAFGSDDLLYLSLGDGGSAHDPLGAGQDLTQLLGSLLRIDPHGSTGGLPYGIPDDNPFRTMPGARDEIWAYGLRNPWRFSFDRRTGELWLGDVGQGAREEVDVVASGDNLGWNVFEGDIPHTNPAGLPASAFKVPLLAYGRDEGRSITGGYVYRGSRLPELRGAYIYGDFASGNIWALRRDNVAVQNTLLANVPQPSSFGEDRDGELLITSHQGALWRLEPTTPGAAEFPRTLSATGLFDDLTTMSPAPGLIEYETNAGMFWDGANVRRFLAAPLEPLVYEPAQPWASPKGSGCVKHF